MLDCDEICANYSDEICKACLDAKRNDKGDMFMEMLTPSQTNMSNIFEYKGYYQDFLDSIEVNLTIPYKLADKISLDIDYKRFVNYFVDAAEEYQIKE